MAVVRVGMAELKLGRVGDSLQALGLGSCVAVACYDRQLHLGGMVHVMLPDSSIGRDGSTAPGKYADTGIPLLLDELLKAGAQKSRLTVKLAGGAEMFAFAGSDAPHLSVGVRNVDAVHRQLGLLGLRIAAEDTGGNSGRTLEVNLETFSCTIKVVGQPEQPL